jgi:hypothetical protein
MTRYKLVGLASGIGLLGLFVGALATRRSPLHEPQPQAGSEPSCKEYADVCAERCEVRNKGVECVACCAEARAACDKSGSYREAFKKCMLAGSHAPE